MIIQSYLPVVGGAQRQVGLLAPLLQARGVAVSVITRRRPADAPVRERSNAADVRRIWAPESAVGSIAYSLGGACALTRVRPEVIHAHDLLSPSTIALAVERPMDVPVVAKVLSTGPGGDVSRLLDKPLGHTRLRRMAKRFSAFICLSAEVEDELEYHGVPRDRLRRIPNGVDPDVYRPPTAEQRRAARRRLGWPADDLVILYTGRFTNVKRLDAIVRALPRAPGTLVLVGEGPEGPLLRRLAEAEGVGSRVRILAPVEDTAAFYAAADLYVSASSTEGMSNAVLEAMATGLPVVAVRASGMSELLDAETGVILPDAHPEALGEALAELAAQPLRRSSLGSAGRRRVERQFSLSATADHLVDLYADVRRARRRTRG